ncbi:hypothetical protein MMC30_002688 [Trapelia coarctata]|nr:hypothetical protein [Trapelia coarctata]
MGTSSSYIKGNPRKWMEKASVDDVTTSFMNLILDGEPGMSPAFTQEHLAAFHTAFDSLSSSTKSSEHVCDEEAFTNYLMSIFPPTYQSLIAAAGPVLFRVALYHATYPFSGSSTNTMTSADLLRAITLLTGRDRLILREAAWKRHVGEGEIKKVVYHIGRTDYDIRRLLFRSMANPKSQLVPRHVTEKNAQVQKVQPPNDDITDVLTVISRVQPRQMEKWSPLPAERFREMATRLSPPRTPLAESHIPCSDFLSLVRLLLTWYTRDVGSAYEPQFLYNVGRRLLERHLSEGEDVSFEVFQKVSKDLLGLSGRPVGPEPHLKGPGVDFVIKRGTRDVILERDMFGCVSQVFENFVGVGTIPFYDPTPNIRKAPKSQPIFIPQTTPLHITLTSTSLLTLFKPPKTPKLSPYRTTIPNNTSTSAPNAPSNPPPTPAPGAPAVELVVAIAFALPLIVPDPIKLLDAIALIVAVLIPPIIVPVPVPVAILLIIPVPVAIAIVSVILAIIEADNTGVPVALIDISIVLFVGSGKPPGIVGTVAVAVVGSAEKVGRVLADVTTPLSPQAANAQEVQVCGLR